MSQLLSQKDFAATLYQYYEFNGIETGAVHKIKCRKRYDLKRIADTQSGIYKVIEKIAKENRTDRDAELTRERAKTIAQMNGYDEEIQKCKTPDERKYVLDRKLSLMDYLKALDHQDPNEISQAEMRSVGTSNPEYLTEVAQLLFLPVDGGATIKEIVDNYDFPPEIFYEGQSFFTESQSKLTTPAKILPKPSQESTANAETS